ncbi:MAG: hypothetical protein QME68_06550 [Elusimicrobiota bacterium]|nr:hypothetical protein [Elusimicrobiota bacterium]
MLELPIRSISGIRGIVGKTMTPIEAYKTTLAFYKQHLSRYVMPHKSLRVVVGRDAKKSGEVILSGVLAALKEVKFKPIYLGITSTPIVQWAVKKYNAIGGIMITASHNPVQYNGIKLFTSPILKPAQMKKVILELDRMDKSAKYENLKLQQIQLPEVKTDTLQKYNQYVIDKIQSIVGKGIICSIKKKKFKVVIDACSKDAAEIPKSFLVAIGVPEKNIFVINDGTIEDSCRRLEPSPKYLVQLRKAIKKYNADIGFAVDPDQDRLVAMPLCSEEHTPLLAAKFLLELQKERKKKFIKSIPVNLSTTSAWEEVASQYGVKIIRTPVGEINVVESMIEGESSGIIFGAEGNGGIILSPVTCCRNSTVGMALLLCYLSMTGKSLRELERYLPKYVMLKTKVTVANPKLTMDQIKEYYKHNSSVSSMNNIDGLKIFLYNNNFWIHIRPSNTEPIIRIIAEGKEREKVEKLVNQLKEKIFQTGFQGGNNE